MQAIILAAGMGKRLKELTKENTKCMIKVNNQTLIERLLNQLDAHNLNKIIIVVGYKSQILIDYIHTLKIQTPIEFIENKIYDKTNNIYSLSLAKEKLCEDDTLLFESDLIFEDSIIDLLLKDERKNIALIDKYESWMDGSCVKIKNTDEIDCFISGKDFKFEEADEYYKTVNIYKFSKQFSKNIYVPFLEAYTTALGNNEYYEQVLKVITFIDNSDLKVAKLNGELWYEIDDIQDLDIASSTFASDEEKLSLLEKRYGGYWRYPHLLDFCYLVNPFFPTKRLIDEIKVDFDKLLRAYPSGINVNSMLAGKDFSVNEENIIVGNGAAELIKSLMSFLNGTTGIIRPTFEEYPNRYDNSKTIVFTPNNENYSYNEKDIIDFFKSKKIDNLIIINPDNPSGNYMKKEELLRLIEWTKEENIKIIIDESFSDFADEEDNTLINQELINKYNNLYIIKSISKSFGVPGLRLGILVSKDVQTIKTMKKDVSIWNINSFAEFYLQIYEKYINDYKDALRKFKLEREYLINNLKNIKNLRIIPSQANYLMLEINDITARELTKSLLIKYGILIKDLSKKVSSNYVRVAIKSREENIKLIDALKGELND